MTLHLQLLSLWHALGSYCGGPGSTACYTLVRIVVYSVAVLWFSPIIIILPVLHTPSITDGTKLQQLSV